MQPKISIIMPVYNSEKYLEKSIDSVLNQTLKDIELIVVNDGSTDDSLDIIKELVRNDSRIKVFSIQNSGPASARNYGLKKASGDFIGFVDSDDFVKDYMFEELYKLADQYNCEIVSCSFEQIDNNGEKIVEKTKFPEGYYGDTDIRSKLYPELIGSEDINNFFPNTMWTKIFSRKLIESNDISFDSKLSFGEDVLFTTHAILTCKNFYYLPDEKLYMYKYNDKSITNSYIENCWNQSLLLNHRFHDLTKDIDYYFKDQITYQLVKSAISSINNEGKQLNKTNYKDRLENIYEIIENDRLIQSSQNISSERFKPVKKIIFSLIKARKGKTLLFLSGLFNVVPF